MRTAVISGGAGGLGRALADRLLSQGWRCVLLDLDVSAIEETGSRIPIACDLTDPAQLDAAARRAIGGSATIDLLIHAAGITHIGPFAELTDAALRRVMDVNFFAAVALSRAFLEPLRAARGTHLALSSVAGFSPLYHRTAYAASKHALEGFFASLRSEERAHGVDVLIAAPSFVATNPGQAGNADGTTRPGSAADGIDRMSPEAAAAVILKGYHRRAPMIPVGRVARISWCLNRLSPRLFQTLMERQIQGRD